MIPASDRPDDDPSHHLIRANQGHSLAVSSEDLLTPVLPSDPDFPKLVVHGTNEEAWRGIKRSGGLKRMSRRHVHFARGVPEALGRRGLKSESNGTPVAKGLSKEQSAKNEREDVVVGDQGAEENVPSISNSSSADVTKVISGMRANATILIWLDVARSMSEGGLKWWKSDNGVILTEGDEQGFVKMEWVDRVERRATGEVLWTREGAEDRK